MSGVEVTTVVGVGKGVLSVAKWLYRVVSPPPEIKAVRKAIPAAVEAAMRAHRPPEEHRLRATLAHRRARRGWERLATAPDARPDYAALRDAAAAGGYVVDDTALDWHGFVDTAAEHIVRQLARSPGGRLVHAAVRAEETAARARDTDVRTARMETVLNALADGALGGRLGPGDAPGGLAVIGRLHEDARSRLVEGHDAHARTLLESGLTLLDAEAWPDAGAARALRQVLFLSLGQVEFRAGDGPAARRRLADAEAAGPFTTPRSRRVAAWLYLNTRRPDRALAALAGERDGTPGWTLLEAVASLQAGDFARYRRVVADDPDLASSADVLAALVHYHADRGAFGAAADTLGALLRLPRTEPSAWVHPVQASVYLLQAYVHADALDGADRFDAAAHVRTTRTLLTDVVTHEAAMSGHERGNVAFERVAFYEALGEAEAAATALAALGAINPREAARLRAAAPVPPSSNGDGPSDADEFEAAAAAPDPAAAAHLRGLAAMARDDFAEAVRHFRAAEADAQSDEERDRALGLALQARAILGEPLGGLFAEAARVPHRARRALCRAVLHAQAGAPGRAFDEFERGVAEVPASVLLLRNALQYVTDVLTKGAGVPPTRAEGEPADPAAPAPAEPPAMSGASARPSSSRSVSEAVPPAGEPTPGGAAPGSPAAGPQPLRRTPLQGPLRERATRLARDLGERLVARVPCPEHSVRRARALLHAGEAGEALAVVRAVEADGYRTRGTAMLLASATLKLGHYREYAEVARRVALEYRRDGHTAFAAAQASVMAGAFAEAARLFALAAERSETDGDSEGADEALVGQAMALADAGRRGADGAGAPTAAAGRAEAERVLLAAHARRPSPRLGAALVVLASSTPRQQATLDRMRAVHGDVSALPGLLAVTREAAEALRRGGEAREEAAKALWGLAVLPVESYARALGRSPADTWLRVQEDPGYLTTDPPGGLRAADGRRRVGRGSSAEALAGAPERAPEEAPPVTYLLDDTALFTLATAEPGEALLESVLRAPALHGRLLVEQATQLRLQAAGLSDPLGEADRRAVRVRAGAAASGARVLAPEAAAHAHDGRPNDSAAASPTTAPGAPQWLVDPGQQSAGPPAEGVVALSSAAVAYALLTAGVVTLSDVTRAAEVDPSAFPNQAPAGPRPDVTLPLVVDRYALGRWAWAGLLDALTRWPGGLWMTSAERDSATQAAADADRTARAVALARDLLVRLTAAVERGAVRWVPRPAAFATRAEVGDPGATGRADGADAASDTPDDSPGPGRTEVPAPETSPSDNAALDAQASLPDAGGAIGSAYPDHRAGLDGVLDSADDDRVDAEVARVLAAVQDLVPYATRVAARRLATAAAEGAVLWSDDAALHMVAEPVGPSAGGNAELDAAVAALRAAYGHIPVAGTGAVAASLAAEGALSNEDTAAIRRALVRNRHWFVVDGGDLARAACAAAGSDGDAPLAYVRRAPDLLPRGAARRSTGVVAEAVTDALRVLLGGGPDGTPAAGVAGPPPDQPAGTAVQPTAAVEVPAAGGLASEQNGAARVLDAFFPWAGAPSPVGPAAAETFWRLLHLQLLRIPADGAVPLVEAVFAGMIARWRGEGWRDAQALADALPTFLVSLVSLPAREPQTFVALLPTTHAVLDAMLRRHTTEWRPDGRDWLPEGLLHLACAAAGVPVATRRRDTVSVCDTAGVTRDVMYTVDLDAAADQAVAAVEAWVVARARVAPPPASGAPPAISGTALAPEGAADAAPERTAGSAETENAIPAADIPDDVGLVVRVTATSEDPSAPPRSVRVRVGRTLLLLRASPAARPVLAELAAREHDRRGAPELAALIRGAASDVARPGPEGTFALCRLYVALLEEPRVWLDGEAPDLALALGLLHDSDGARPFAMLGDMPLWRTGDTLLAYGDRTDRGAATSPAWGAARAALARGTRLLATFVVRELEDACAAAGYDVGAPAVPGGPAVADDAGRDDADSPSANVADEHGSADPDSPDAPATGARAAEGGPAEALPVGEAHTGGSPAGEPEAGQMWDGETGARARALARAASHLVARALTHVNPYVRADALTAAGLLCWDGPHIGSLRFDLGDGADASLDHLAPLAGRLLVEVVGAVFAARLRAGPPTTPPADDLVADAGHAEAGAAGEAPAPNPESPSTADVGTSADAEADAVGVASEPANDKAPSTAEKVIESLVQAGRMYDALHADVARATLAAVVTNAHANAVAAGLPERDRAGISEGNIGDLAPPSVDTPLVDAPSHDAPPAEVAPAVEGTSTAAAPPSAGPPGTAQIDVIGALIAAARALAPLVYDAATTVAAHVGIDEARAALGRARGRRREGVALVLTRELSDPDLLGPEPPFADPYRAALVYALETFADAAYRARDDRPPLAAGPPRWASAAVLAALDALAAASPTPAEAELAHRAELADVEDRFDSVLTVPTAERARRVLTLFGQAAPAGAGQPEMVSGTAELPAAPPVSPGQGYTDLAA